MKVESLTIHRINVTLSCGCGVVCDFKDLPCKDPFKPIKGDAQATIEQGIGPQDKMMASNESGILTERAITLKAAKVFSICEKHRDDSQRSMLEFMMAERMDEAVEDAQRSAQHPPRQAGTPVTQEGLEGESVNKVTSFPGGGHRPQHPLGVRKLTRSPESLAKAGALATHQEKEVEVGEGVGSVADLDKLLAEPSAPTAP